MRRVKWRERNGVIFGEKVNWGTAVGRGLMIYGMISEVWFRARFVLRTYFCVRRLPGVRGIVVNLHRATDLDFLRLTFDEVAFHQASFAADAIRDSYLAFILNLVDGSHRRGFGKSGNPDS